MRRGLRGARRGPGLLGTVARTAVVAGTASAVAGGVSSAQQASAQQRQQGLDARAQLAEQQRRAEVDAQVAARQAPPPPAPAAGSGDVLAQLTQLGELWASGVLTDEEFATQKARILGT